MGMRRRTSGSVCLTEISNFSPPKRSLKSSTVAGEILGSSKSTKDLSSTFWRWNCVWSPERVTMPVLSLPKMLLSVSDFPVPVGPWSTRVLILLWRCSAIILIQTRREMMSVSFSLNMFSIHLMLS